MRTTIKDIANYTGLSVTTISLVLNKKANKIPEATRLKVQEAVKKLNYHPNQLAVGLVKKRTQTIGLIISDVSNAFFSILAKGVEDTCRQCGWNLILCNTNDEHEREMSYIQVLADRGADGILFCMARDNDRKKTQESIKLLKKMTMPFIMIDRHIDASECSSVIADHMHGGYNAAKYLLELGHRRIGCITGPNNLQDSMERLNGYKKALLEWNVSYDETLIYEGRYDYESGVAAAEYLMAKKVTAIFAFNDLSAYGAYSRIKKQGYKIPEDISLIGYDDIFFSGLLDVPLTSVHQPIYEMGVAAVKQLIDELEHESMHRKVIFDTQLMIRESTGRIL